MSIELHEFWRLVKLMVRCVIFNSNPDKGTIETVRQVCFGGGSGILGAVGQYVVVGRKVKNKWFSFDGPSDATYWSAFF